MRKVEGVRGSTAITGAVDVILEYERPRVAAKARNADPEVDKAHPTRRVIKALSRFPDTPDELMFDWDARNQAYAMISETNAGIEIDSAQQAAKSPGKLC